MEAQQWFLQYRPLLLRLAYRILGSYSDAEDIVQDVFVEMNGRDLTDIRNPKAYLTKTVANRSINVLKSARRTKETYVGPWLPEPALGVAPDEPGDAVEHRESLSYAFLVLLERLTPEERVAFVLREALGYEYAEISDLLDKSEAACRQLYSRARRKLPQSSAAASAHAGKADGFARAFLQASETGDFRPFVRLLARDAGLLTDGGGKVRAATKTVAGRERIAKLFEGIAPKGFFEGDAQLVRQGADVGVRLTRDGATAWVAFFEPTPDRSALQSVFIVLNPDKLRYAGPSDRPV